MVNVNRLPRTVIPRSYQINLEPHLEEFTYKGSEVVDLHFEDSTSTIALHSSPTDLTLDNSSTVFVDASGKEIAPTSVSQDGSVLSLVFPNNFAAGSDGKLKLAFNGILNDKLVGFYRSKYSVGDQTRHMAVTQFEPVDARRAFPCWDDPSFKAKWNMTVTAPRGCVAVSNMPATQIQQLTDGRSVYHFAESPIMSSYLVAVCVGEFEYLEATAPSGTTIRVYTTPGKKEQGKFAVEAAIQALEMFTKFFGIKYPLPKLDLLAIPDFSAGAMENWGCITYRETALLVQEGQSSMATIMNACRTIAHEIAHQWFGNLVTMEWWTHLWLNEGFARWAETLCLDEIHPEWNFWMYFLANAYIAAQNLDSLVSSHAIEVEVQKENQINEIFDSISYAKGACVIRMLAAFLGKEVFRAGLHAYLTRFQYQNTVTEDLWDALTKQSQYPVAQMMRSWTKQVGYPIVTVKQVSQEGDQYTFELSQSRYLRSTVPDQQSADSVWQIPLSIRIQKTGGKDKGRVVSVLMTEKTTSIKLDIKSDEWFYLNDGQSGLFRVAYPDDWFRKLTLALEAGDLSQEVRLGLQNDVFARVRAGLAPASQYLQLLQCYRGERQSHVWSDILSNLSVLSHLYEELPFYDLFTKYVASIVEPVYSELGWEARSDDDSLTGSFRSAVIGFLAGISHGPTVEEGRKRFAQLTQPGAKPSVSPDLFAVVYRLGVVNGGPAEFDLMLRRFGESTLAEEQRRCLAALGATKDQSHITELLEKVLNGTIRAQNIAVPASAMSARPASRRLAWEWTKSKWPQISAKFGDSLFVFSNFVGSIVGGFTDHATANEVEAFFKQNPTPQAERTILQSVEKIRSNADWIARDASVAAWLKYHQK